HDAGTGESRAGVRSLVRSTTMSDSRRVLVPADAAALERFLVEHRDSSMFLRANSRRAGLEYRGKPEQATYLAAFSGDEIVGVVPHAWTGGLLVQAPEGVEELALECVHASGRKVTALIGPLEQVRRARSALGLDGTPGNKNEHEGLYALSLSELIVP